MQFPSNVLPGQLSDSSVHSSVEWETQDYQMIPSPYVLWYFHWQIRALMARHACPPKLSKHQHASCSFQHSPEPYLKPGLLLLLCTWRSLRGPSSHFTEHCYWSDSVPCSTPTSFPSLEISVPEQHSRNNAFGEKMHHNRYEKARSICWKFPKRYEVLTFALTHAQREMLLHAVNADPPTHLFH